MGGGLPCESSTPSRRLTAVPCRGGSAVWLCSVEHFAALSILLLKLLSQERFLQESKPTKVSLVTQLTCAEFMSELQKEAPHPLKEITSSLHRNSLFPCCRWQRRQTASLLRGWWRLLWNRPLAHFHCLVRIAGLRLPALCFQARVAVLCRRMSLGLRWARDARTANASGGLMCCRGAGHRLPLEEEVQQGPDDAKPLRSPPLQLPFLGVPPPLHVSDVMQKMYLILDAS